MERAYKYTNRDMLAMFLCRMNMAEETAKEIVEVINDYDYEWTMQDDNDAVTFVLEVVCLNDMRRYFTADIGAEAEEKLSAVNKVYEYLLDRTAIKIL